MSGCWTNWLRDPAMTVLPDRVSNGTLTRINDPIHREYGFSLTSTADDGAQTSLLFHQDLPAGYDAFVLSARFECDSSIPLRNGRPLIIGGTKDTTGTWFELARLGDGSGKPGAQDLVARFTLPDYGYTSLQAVFSSPLKTGETVRVTRLMLMTAADWDSYSMDPPAKQAYSADMPIILGGGA